MKLTADESRALAFIAGLLLLSAAVRLAGAREPLDLPEGGFDLQAHIQATREAVEEAERAGRPLAEGERVDPNRADAIELDRLPRVGPALAGRIIADRERNGPFRSIEDLGRVRGVGERMLEQIRGHIELPSAPHGGTRRGPLTASARTPASAEGRPLASAGAGDGAPTPAAPLDLNRADAETLATLPGIGPVLATRIVAYRDSAGPFREVEELVGVKGVGQATLAKLRELVNVGG